MNHSRTLSSLLLVSTLALPPAAFARPSFRSIRDNGVEQEQSAAAAKKKSVTAASKQKYERREHPHGGMSAEIPKDWELYIPGKNWKDFAEDIALYYRERKEGATLLGFGKKYMGRPANLEDAHTLFEDYVRQPINDFELLNLPYIHDYKFVSSDTISIGGISAREDTYTYSSQSVHWQERDIRIPIGNEIIVLMYRSPVSFFEQDLVLFNKLKESMLLTKPTKARSAQNKKNSLSSSSISERRIPKSSMARSRSSAR